MAYGRVNVGSISKFKANSKFIGCMWRSTLRPSSSPNCIDIKNGYYVYALGDSKMEIERRNILTNAFSASKLIKTEDGDYIRAIHIDELNNVYVGTDKGYIIKLSYNFSIIFQKKIFNSNNSRYACLDYIYVLNKKLFLSTIYNTNIYRFSENGEEEKKLELSRNISCIGKAYDNYMFIGMVGKILILDEELSTIWEYENKNINAVKDVVMDKEYIYASCNYSDKNTGYILKINKNTKEFTEHYISFYSTSFINIDSNGDLCVTAYFSGNGNTFTKYNKDTMNKIIEFSPYYYADGISKMNDDYFIMFEYGYKGDPPIIKPQMSSFLSVVATKQ